MYKVILVDDESRVRETICRLTDWSRLNLALAGSCENAVDALELLTEEPADILLTDVRMPVMDGLELIARAKQLAPQLVCAVLSGYDDFSLVQAALREGAVDYLLKPCRLEELEDALRRCAAAVGRQKRDMLSALGERRRVAERLCGELMELQPGENGSLEGESVRALAESFGDLSLLSEAVTLLMARCEAVLPGAPVSRIARLIEAEEPFEQAAILLGEIHRAMADNEGVVEQTARFVSEHYDLPGLTLQYVAEQVIHINAQHLGKRFLKQKGMKFGDYLLKTRMEKAKLLLRAPGEHRVYEIAAQIGLGNNVQYFYQVFKRYTGMTPREYQAQGE